MDHSKEIKAFHMRLNDDEPVAAMDLLAPGMGQTPSPRTPGSAEF